mmetsp:Transcript_22683/g.61438  ORF Transcript_22683/g.61438 Transcript_22683/m.61438 type:complete len:212 (+) Transcript_22683:1020-1655(+)
MCCSGHTPTAAPGTGAPRRPPPRAGIWPCCSGRAPTVAPGTRPRAHPPLSAATWPSSPGCAPMAAPGTLGVPPMQPSPATRTCCSGRMTMAALERKGSSQASVRSRCAAAARSQADARPSLSSTHVHHATPATAQLWRHRQTRFAPPHHQLWSERVLVRRPQSTEGSPLYPRMRRPFPWTALAPPPSMTQTIFRGRNKSAVGSRMDEQMKI